MNKEEHIHKFVRIPGKNTVGKVRYRCVQPNCYFVVSKDLLLGKQSLCSVCDTPIILDHYDLRRAAPRCINCKTTKEANQLKQAASIAGKLFGVPTQEDSEVK